jgi:hypothetical protein
MASRFWVTGGTGNWNDTSNWSATTGGASGASVPVSADTATFDASSGSGTVTLDISPVIQAINCSGFTGTLAFGTNTISLNSTGTIFTGATTMTVTGTPLIICTNSSATSRTLSSGGAVTEANSISIRITAGTGTVALGTSSYRNLDFTDGTNPTGYAGALSSSTVTVFGDFKASTGMTVTAGTGVLSFAATSGIKTINTAGVTFDRPFTFNGVGGTFQLQAALTSGATRACTLTNGTLDLNGYTATFGSVSSSNSNVRTFAFGSTGKFVLLNTAATVWTTSTATNLTLTGSKTVEVTGAGLSGQTRVISSSSVSAGGTILNAPSFYVKAGADTLDLASSARVFTTLDFTGFSGSIAANATLNIYGDLVLSTGMTITGGISAWTFVATTLQTITTNGKTIDNPITFNGVGGTWAMQDALTLGSTRALTMTNGTLQLKAGTTSTVGSFVTSGTNPKFLTSTTYGSQATISATTGTFTVSYLTIQDNIATGGATWDALAITNVDAGNNTGWLFSSTPSIGNEVEMRLRSFTQPRRF